MMIALRFKYFAHIGLFLAIVNTPTQKASVFRIVLSIGVRGSSEARSFCMRSSDSLPIIVKSRGLLSLWTRLEMRRIVPSDSRVARRKTK